MKKILLFLLVLVGFVSLPATSVFAEEVATEPTPEVEETTPEETEPAPEFVQKVYVHTEDNQTFKITLLSETTCELELTDATGFVQKKEFTYTLEENVLTIADEIQVVLNENGTFDEYIVPVEKDPFDIGEFLMQYFPPEVVTTIGGIIATFISIIVLMFKLHNEKKKGKNTEHMTIDELKERILEVLGEKVAELLEPALNKLNEMETSLKGFAKALALSQDATPESKLAILDLIGSMNLVDEKTINNTKEEIIKEQEQAEAKKTKKVEQLEKIAEKPVE